MQGDTTCLWPSSILHTTCAIPALSRQTDCLLVPSFFGVCFATLISNWFSFYFLASLPDVQLVFGGRVALIAVTAMTAVLTIPAKKSKLKNVEVEVLVG